MLKKIGLIAIFVNFLIAQESILDRVLQEKSIKVCIWPEYYGISYLDARTQKLVGIDSDLALELGKDLGAEVEFVSSSFASLISDVNSDKCDIAMFAIALTQERKEKLRFTTPHLVSDVYAITTNTNKRIKNWDDIDKDGVVVAVAKGTYHENLMKNRLKSAKLLVLDSYKAREEEVRSGRADVFMTDYPFSKRMLEQTDWAKLISPNSTYSLTSYGWVVKYGDDKFYNRIEQFIADIKKDGRLKTLSKKSGLELIVKF